MTGMPKPSLADKLATTSPRAENPIPFNIASYEPLATVSTHQGGGNTGLKKHHGASHDGRAGLDNLTKHDQAVNRTGNVSYTDPLHTRDYSPKGKNPGDVMDRTPRKEDIFLGEDHNPHEVRGNPKDPGDVVEHTSVRHKAWMSTPGHPYTHKATGEPQNPGDYWELTTQPYKGTHFAVYPEKLCVRPIKASSRVGDVVLDMFCGSGTTGVVAKRLGRKFILIDSVEKYCELAKNRVAKVEYQPELQQL
jgi:DNA modification methylase